MEVDAERVFGYIWSYLVEHEALPTQSQIMDALGYSEARLMKLIDFLRHTGRLRATTLYPIAFDTWWRQNRRTPDHANNRIAALPKQKLGTRRR